MSTTMEVPGPFGPPMNTRRSLYAAGIMLALTVGLFAVSSRLRSELLASDFLPHRFCYLSRPALVWTHVVTDSLIAMAYLAISITLAYLVYKARSDIPFHWMFLSFGLFIVACGSTHIMEVVTVWTPVYVMSAVAKLFTVIVSLMTAMVFPFTVPRVLTLVRQAKMSEQNTANLRASEERKEALLREVHHRVKNNLAIICSLFYLQSTHTQDQQTVTVFCDMEDRVRSMALVHEFLYGSDNLARIDFAEYADALARTVLSSHQGPGKQVEFESDLETVIMGADLAVPCGLILNELITNALKHGIETGSGGKIKLTLRKENHGKCTLCVEDSGTAVPTGLDLNVGKPLGLRLVRSLTRQIRGSFELVNVNHGTSARLQFLVGPS